MILVVLKKSLFLHLLKTQIKRQVNIVNTSVCVHIHICRALEALSTKNYNSLGRSAGENQEATYLDFVEVRQ